MSDKQRMVNVSILHETARSYRPLLTGQFTVGFVEDVCALCKEQAAEIERLERAGLCWDAFRDWCDAHGVNKEHEKDWVPWWKCWAAAIKAKEQAT
jgi:hypothetical protein